MSKIDIRERKSENSKMKFIILIWAIKVIKDLNTDTTISTMIINNRATVFSEISFKIATLSFAQLMLLDAFSLYFSSIVIIRATIANETEKSVISAFIIKS